MRSFIVITTSIFSAIAAADPPKPDTEVFFDPGSAWLDDQSTAQLHEIAARAADIPGTKVVLDAHTDTRGSSPYNVGLSLRRAVAVRSFLTAHGFNADRIVLAAYGEDGPRRDTKAHDRRVSVTLTAEPLYSIIDGSKPYATAVIWNTPATLAEMQGPPDKVPQTARR